jgi:DNA-binding NarL/FixJ family response regulator
LGAMTYASVAPERYQASDVALAEQVARRVAFAVDNGRLYREARSAEARYQRLFSKQFRSRPGGTRSTADVLPLTPRELDVLQLLVAGASTREIAKRLVVSDYAVRYHLRNLFRKLEVHTRIQLVAQALHLGLARSPGST